MENVILRERARERGVKMWELAEGLGITDSTLSRKLRRELPEQEQKQLLQMVDLIADRRNA